MSTLLVDEIVAVPSSTSGGVAVGVADLLPVVVTLFTLGVSDSVTTIGDNTVLPSGNGYFLGRPRFPGG